MAQRILDVPAVSADGDRSLTALLRDLSDGTAQLVRQEIRLAKAETVEGLRQARGGAVQLAIAAGLGLMAAGALLAAIIVGLGDLLDGKMWLSALIVAVVLGVLAFMFLKRGTSALSPSKLLPDQTASSIRETASWLKHPTTSATISR